MPVKKEGTLIDSTIDRSRIALSRVGAALVACLALSLAAGCGDDDEGPIDPGPDLNAAGVITTWAGDGQAGFDGDGNTLLGSSFYWPSDLLFTSDDEVYILDWNNHRVRHVTADGRLETAIGDFVGDGPPDQSDLTPAGAPGTTVSLNHPTDLSELADGRLLVTAWHNHKLRTYDPLTGLVHVFSGNTPGFVDGVAAKDGRFNQPPSSVVAADGTIFTLDQRNQRIRMIGTDGMISTVVGTGVRGYNGDGIAPLEAQINQPFGSNPTPGGGVALDAQERLYFSDLLNSRVRRVNFQLNIIETVAGNGTAGYSGDGGQATAAQIKSPRDLEIKDGVLYIAEEGNHVIRAVDLTTGVISTFAGTGVAGFSGDRGQATLAQLYAPTGIAFDSAGDMYVADSQNNRIRKINL
ncbi:MAG: hypothetical protein ACKVU1_06760 [bacterium]